MAFTQFIAVGSGFVSMAMLSHLGKEVLAASALIFSTRIAILLIGSSILFALSILVGHAYGEKDHQRIGNFAQQGWLLGLLLSLPIMLLFWKMRVIFIALGQDRYITDITQDFFNANIWNVPAFLLSVANQQLCYGVQKQKIDLWGNVLGMPILFLSAYALIFGHFGFHALGVAGLGYALNLQGWFYCLFTLTIFCFNNDFKSFQLFSFRLHKHYHDLLRMLKIGWPIAVQISGELLSFVASTAIVGWLGAPSLAAYQVVMQYLFLVLVPLFAIAQASGVLVGKAYGEKNYFKIKAIGHAGVLFSIIISVIVAGIFMAYPKELASLYLNIHNPANAEILHFIVILFIILGIQQIIDGARNIFTGALRGMFDTQFPMIVGLIVIWIIGLPLGYFMAFNLHWGVYGVETGITLGLLIGAIILTMRWHYFNKKLQYRALESLPSM